ncbi:MAG TPA: flap endonuclease-1 [Candidatus Nanoarchaeia archaeon]|nr:flap endonuclease-1 [Candidatus Nanoarchaeia archaeon]
MGLSIKDIIPRKEIETEDLKGKTVCVDAFNILYQFLSTIRQFDGTPLMDSKQRITSHLSGLFYRNISLLSQGIKLIYVFDGKPPELKGKIHKERKESRELAKERYEEAKQHEDYEKMKSYSSQLVRLNDEMIKESKELLKAMGIQAIQAPSEGEAQAAKMCRNNKKIYSVVSQDYDSLLYGTPRLVRNLTISKRKKTPQGQIEILPEIIELERVLNYLEINLQQLICLGILVGTDYNPKGVPGIGQKKALEIVRKKRIPYEIFEEVEEKIMSLPEEERFDWKEIFPLFNKPEVDNFDINFPEIDENKIKEILVNEHDFSEERVEKQIEKLKIAKEKNKQKGLNEWF